MQNRIQRTTVTAGADVITAEDLGLSEATLRRTGNEQRNESL